MINECDDGLMLEGFRTLAKYPRAVACVHCENTDVIGRYVARVRASGRNDLAAWNAARPAFAEAENVRRASPCTTAGRSAAGRWPRSCAAR
jgi:dihydropyrimidinase